MKSKFTTEARRHGWRRLVFRMGLAILLITLAVSAQTKKEAAAPPEIVPVDQEPSHHLVFENEYVRVFSVEVAPHSETKYHQHDRDYVWVSLGDSDVESVRVGASAVALQPKDGETQFTKGGFAHKAVNKSDKPFRNVTVELKKGAGESTRNPSTSDPTFPRHRSTAIVSTSKVECEQVSAEDRQSATGAVLGTGKYLVIAKGLYLKVYCCGGPKIKDIDLMGAHAMWVQGSRDSFDALSEMGAPGITHCEFKDETQGPSHQKEGARDDKARGAGEKEGLSKDKR